MAHEFVGLICGASTGRVYAIVNPDDDNELDNPRFLLLGVGVTSNQKELAPPWTPNPDQDPDEPENEPAPLREPITILKIPLNLYMTFNHPVQIANWAKERISP